MEGDESLTMLKEVRDRHAAKMSAGTFSSDEAASDQYEQLKYLNFRAKQTQMIAKARADRKK